MLITGKHTPAQSLSRLQGIPQQAGAQINGMQSDGRPNCTFFQAHSDASSIMCKSPKCLMKRKLWVFVARQCAFVAGRKHVPSVHIAWLPLVQFWFMNCWFDPVWCQCDGFDCLCEACASLASTNSFLFFFLVHIVCQCASATQKLD